MTKKRSLLKRLWYLLLVSSVCFTPAYEIGQAQLEEHSIQLASSTPGYGVQLLSSSAQGAELELQTPRAQIALLPAFTAGGNNPAQPDAWQISLPGAEQQVQPGKPQLPGVSALLGVPPGAQVRLEILEGQAQPFSLPGPLAFAQPIAPQSDEFVNVTPGWFAPNFDPAGAPVQMEEAWLRNQRLLKLVFYPLGLDARGELVWRPTLRVIVHFDETDEFASNQATLPAVRAGNPFVSVLRSQVLNYEEAQAWQSLPRVDGDTLSLNVTAAATRYRLPIFQDGIYRLTYENLQAAGLDVAHLDPTRLALSSQGQTVALYRSDTDGNPSVFSPGEYLLFYGQKFSGARMAQSHANENAHYMTYNRQMPDGSIVAWKPQFNAKMVEKYTNENVYWLELGTDPGAAMSVVAAPPGSGTTPGSFRSSAHAEEERVWRVSGLWSGEESFYWENISVGTPSVRAYTISLPAPLATGASAVVTGEIAALNSSNSGSPDHRLQFFFNDAAQSELLHEATWDGTSRYRFSFSVPAAKLLDGVNTLQIKVLPTASVPNTRLYFDWFEVAYDRQFVAAADSLGFQADSVGTWKFGINGFGAAPVAVLDVTQPLAPVWLTGATLTGGRLEFGRTVAAGAAFHAAVPVDLGPGQISAYTAPDFSTPADYVIITHHDFMEKAQELADHRVAQGLSARVFDFADLVNSFTDGIYHPLAIKDFLKWTFANWDTPPIYVVLVGDGHWNLKGMTTYDNPPAFLPPNLGWVDPWQGEVDSANLLATVVGNDPLPDVYIGRIPVNSVEQLDGVIQKIFSYEAAALAPEDPWYLHVAVVADNVPDAAGDFVAYSEAFIGDYIENGYQADRFYLNDYIAAGSCVKGQKCEPLTSDLITNTLNTTGALLVNYTGHGYTNAWAAEQILKVGDQPDFDNAGRLPVVVSLDCADGYWIHPNLAASSGKGPGLIEELLRIPGNGIIAAFAPNGLGVGTGHDAIQRGFYDSVFKAGNWELGPATESAQLKLYATGWNYDLLQTFILFGDPAMRIASPYGMQLSPQSVERGNAPGRTVPYQLQVTNTGLLADTFEVSLGASAWMASAPAVVGPLAPGASAVLEVRVTIPLTAGDGDTNALLVNVTSRRDRAQMAQTEIRTLAQLYGVNLLPDTQAQLVPPGTVLTYTLAVENAGVHPDRYSLTLANGLWLKSPEFPLQVGPLEGGAVENVTIQVQAPLTATRGASSEIQILAVSEAQPEKTGLARLTTQVGVYELALQAPVTAQTGEPGTLLSYTLTLANTGDFADAYTLSIVASAWDTQIVAAPAQLLPGQSGEVVVQVTVPAAGAPGSTDTAKVQVVSQAWPAEQAELDLVSQVAQPVDGMYYLYMPQVRR